MKNYKVIGIMSGTSLDGVDIAFINFMEENGRWKFELQKAETIAYDDIWRNKLATAHQLSALEFALLNVEYGHFLGALISDFMISKSLKPDFIASHGHTIYHQPHLKLTTQIGDGASIASICNTPVVCDFRTTDVALGGQGAPLVPIGDKLLFADYDYCLNLGGIANISFDLNNLRIAGDICPVNMVLNHLVKPLGLAYDNAGELAKAGKIDTDLLNRLNALDHYSKPFQKSLGREYIFENIIPLMMNNYLSVNDKLATFIEHISHQINQLILRNDKYNQLGKRMLITGGGTFNDHLITSLKEKSSLEICIPNEDLINFKEAIIFGFLGVLRMRNEKNCLASVTGASRDSVGGAIYL